MLKELLSRQNEFASECNLFLSLAWEGMNLIAPYDENVKHQRIAKDAMVCVELSCQQDIGESKKQLSRGRMLVKATERDIVK